MSSGLLISLEDIQCCHSSSTVFHFAVLSPSLWEWPQHPSSS